MNTPKPERVCPDCNGKGITLIDSDEISSRTIEVGGDWAYPDFIQYRSEFYQCSNDKTYRWICVVNID